MEGTEPRFPTWRVWGVTFDARIAQMVIVATLALLIEFYYKLLPLEYNRVLFHFLVPLAVIVLLWREGPRAYGLRVGDWRLGLPLVLPAIAVMVPLIWFAGRQQAFVDFYTPLLRDRPAWQIVLEVGLELFAWEFFCRGWLLWGFGRKYGADAIWLQAMPFALMHLLKPPLESVTTIFGGALFGLLAWRTRSCLYGFLIHWFMVAFMLLVAGGLL